MTGTRSRPTSKDIIEIVKRLEPRLGPIAQAITQEIWAEIPGYRALEDEGAREEVAEAAQRNLTAFLRALGEGHDLPKRDIDALAVVGETRAHQGIPIEDVLKAFRTVGRVLWDH